MRLTYGDGNRAGIGGAGVNSSAGWWDAQGEERPTGSSDEVDEPCFDGVEDGILLHGFGANAGSIALSAHSSYSILSIRRSPRSYNARG